MARLTRIYPNGEKRVLNSDDPSFATEYHGISGSPDSWYEYNERNRGGCYLFIDGVCVHTGCLKLALVGQVIGPLQDEERRIVAAKG